MPRQAKSRQLAVAGEVAGDPEKKVSGSATSKRIRATTSAHPGVVLIPPKDGHPTWRARCQSPDTGGRTFVRLDPQGAGRSAETRRRWAIERSRAIAKRSDEISSGAPRASGTQLRAAVQRYFDDHPRLRKRTLEIYQLHAEEFIAWADSAGIRKSDDLTRAHLVAFQAARAGLRKHVSSSGKKGAKTQTKTLRSPATINIELRAVRTILGYLRRLGLTVRLQSDDLTDGLKRVPASHDAPEFLRPPDIRKLLLACQAHDAETFKATREEHAGKSPKGSTPRYEPIAPLVVVALLSGMRYGELLGLDWSEVDLDEGEIRLTSKTKTKRARTVDLSLSPVLVEILGAQAPKAERKGPVWKLTGDEVKAAAKRLTSKYGAPGFWNWQALRRTCGTYLTNAPGIFGAASAYRSARQLGHSVQVAERHYLGVVKVAKEAGTVEAAMQVEDELSVLTK